MLTCTIAYILSEQHFKRRFGVESKTFFTMAERLKPQWRATPKPGAKPTLNLQERVLVT
ncbi:MAG: hypothetical protein F6K09_18000 [Merismopedia sp. SIO2A8]|nr:hypothetical protein [Merismopedia sp. SIO2A8]